MSNALEFFTTKVGGQKHTIGQFIEAVMSISDPIEALLFYQGYLQWLETQDTSEHPVEYVAKVNIGWCFGEGMSPRRVEMWSKVCGAYHPVFGTTTNIDPKEAFEAGIKVAREESD